MVFFYTLDAARYTLVSVHHAAPWVHPRVRRAGDTEDFRGDGAAALLPHVELPAGAAQGLLAIVAIDDGGDLPADLANLLSVSDAHIRIPRVKMIQFSRNRREGESCQRTMPENRYWTVGAFAGNDSEAGKKLSR
jgi:hypothetical protein